MHSKLEEVIRENNNVIIFYLCEKNKKNFSEFNIILKVKYKTSLEIKIKQKVQKRNEKERIDCRAD